MIKLLVIADDFTGAFDTGVQFAARGAITRVVTDLSYAFHRADPSVSVLVIDAETRHCKPEQARAAVSRIVSRALSAGIPYIYKKTDSALRGNIGAELEAVMESAEIEQIPFFPAFPKLNRTTKGGIHYIEGIPADQSVFGRDPFEPVCSANVASVLAMQAATPAVSLLPGQISKKPGIHIYDAVTDEDFRITTEKLGLEKLRISAGCAGFAEELARILKLEGERPVLPLTEAPLFVICGSVNRVTLDQLAMAEQAGHPRIFLTPEEKLNLHWMDTDAGKRKIRKWVELCRNHLCCMLDVNDPTGHTGVEIYAKKTGMSRLEVRQRITEVLGRIVQALLDAGLEATLLCTGGDTLLAVVRQVGITELTPIGEVATGVVLTGLRYRGRYYYLISKSGGFGDAELFCDLAARVTHLGCKEKVVS